MEVPKYLEKGSEGPVVTVLLAFLAGYNPKEDLPEGFRVDAKLGDQGMVLIAKYQEENGLTAEGGCGSEMRENLLVVDGFDFELAARSVGGTTTFVQPGGEAIVWYGGLSFED